MAKYYITYSCGHEGCVDIIGTNSHGERDRKVEWYKNVAVCPECYAKQREAEKVAAAQKAAAQAEEIGLPELTGSEKQIAWAETIRTKLVAENIQLISIVRQQREKVDAAIAKTPEDPRAIAFSKAIKIIEETSAKWFIENRF